MGSTIIWKLRNRVITWRALKCVDKIVTNTIPIIRKTWSAVIGSPLLFFFIFSSKQLLHKKTISNIFSLVSPSPTIPLLPNLHLFQTSNLSRFHYFFIHKLSHHLTILSSFNSHQTFFYNVFISLITCFF